jgi:hypothetical protein
MTNRLKWMRGTCLLLFLVVSLQQVAPQARDFTVVWSPRITDVGDAQSASYQSLQALLQLLPTIQYDVQPTDSLDKIIRTHFLVSASFHNAYQLYFERVISLNSGLPNRMLKPGDVIVLPSGPTFYATRLSEQHLTPIVQNSVLSSLYKSAYSTQSSSMATTIARRDLSRFTGLKSGAAADAVDDALFSQGIAPAIAAKPGKWSAEPLVQTYNLSITSKDAQGTFATLLKATPQIVYPRIVPMAAPVSVTCQPQQCSTCSNLLEVPPGTDTSRARVLVADTGEALAIPSSNVIDVGDGPNTDDSPDSHGTFVFSEIAAPTPAFAALSGILPLGQVFSAKVAHKAPDGSVSFSIQDIITAWQNFGTSMHNDPNAAYTSIVNLSAAGTLPADVAKQIAPQLPPADNILVVAAAGDRPNAIDPVEQLFGKLSTEDANLIVVGATGQNGKIASYSNYNATHVQLFERGDCVCGNPGQLDGTSQAAPIVAAAAAILASARPDWNAYQVKWRLISTGSYVPDLHGMGILGTVDLQAALTKAIIVRTTSGSPPLMTVGQITFDSGWNAAFGSTTLLSSDMPLLRLFDPRIVNQAVCFTALQWMNFVEQDICVPPAATIYFPTQNGSAGSLRADQLSDLILPIPSDRDSSSGPLTIQFAPN